MKMILIAEDEFLVRIGLKTTISWEDHGYTIVGEAANGKEALQLFEELSPDIVITDVKMPMMDGLELLAEIKRRNKSTHVIILSNYNEFEYAREALRLGASQYLLKAEINEERLLSMLNALPGCAAPSENHEDEGKVRLERYLRQMLYFDLEKQVPSMRPDMLSLLEKTHYAVLRADGDWDFSEMTDSDNLLRNIESLVLSSFDDALCLSSVQNTRLRLFALLPAPSCGAEDETRLRKKIGLMHRNAKYYFQVELRIGLSAIHPIASVDKAIYEAERARLCCFFFQESILPYSDIAHRVHAAQVDPVSKKIIDQCVHARDLQGLHTYVRDIFSALAKNESFSGIRSAYIDFISIAKSICQEQSISFADGLSGVKFSYDTLMQIATIRNVEDYICDIYDAIIETLSGTGERYSYTIRQCLSFISEHYADAISLDSMANSVNISKSYLSMLFKQEMGVNFVAYLTQYRIQQAKELLANSSMKIYEIADKVGFSSPYYFSKIFKETVGQTCKEYRDQFGN